MPQNKDTYQKKYNSLVGRHDILVGEIESIEMQLLEERHHQKELHIFLESLNQQSELLGEFDELLWKPW
ncbi:hypothetical protein [Streptococcus minor]|uniref:hypothetical protein n=1 Tax=Streptococcus minor TaxID=229549 RepID=UPI00036CE96B|nr:hypothetical protein [Streptococcus minor]